MDTGPTKQRSNTNRLHAWPPSARMRSVVSEPISGAHMDPPRLLAYPHSGFILMDHVCLDQCGFQVRFDLCQLLMTRFDERGDTARRELDPEQIVEELAGTSIRHSLALNQRDSHC